MTADARRAKEANSRFYRLMDRTEFHIRVPNEQGMSVTLVGHAADLHGPDGVCSCCHGRSTGLAAKAQGQAVAIAAHPSEAARVEAAIRQLAATGKPFSANDARAIHGVRGGVVGATFTAMRKARVIRAVGDEISDQPSTNGHRIYQWIGVAA